MIFAELEIAWKDVVSCDFFCKLLGEDGLLNFLEIHHENWSFEGNFFSERWGYSYSQDCWEDDVFH